MNDENIGLIDDTGDRKYFTIIPNYVLTHTSIWDSAVYIQMKYVSGENGSCWLSRQTLAKRCGMSLSRVQKSLHSLLTLELIEKVGQRIVETPGGLQYVNEYKMTDIWKKNVDVISENPRKQGRSLENRPISRKPTLGENQEIKVGLQKTSNKIYINLEQEHIAKASRTSAGNSDVPSPAIANLINLFKTVNPSYQRLFGMRPQRDACARLIKLHTYEKLERLMIALPEIVVMPYAPKITSPYELEKNLGKLLQFIEQEKNKKINNTRESI